MQDPTATTPSVIAASDEAGTPPAAAPTTESPPPSAKYVTHELTFYGWPDNSPPGAGIALPQIHTKAGGVGTYADPITFATDPRELPAGTRLYIPMIQKYAIMEDTCAACIADWSSGKRHVDVWMNSDSTNSENLRSCQHSWTRPAAEIEINPPPGRPVTTGPLFETSAGACRTTP